MFDIYGKKRIALNFESKSIEATYNIRVVYHQSKPFKQYSESFCLPKYKSN